MTTSDPSPASGNSLIGYDRSRSYSWNYDHPPEVVEVPLAEIPGAWTFCRQPVSSPLGMPAGPLLNGRWILFYAALGFDVLTYKTVRSGVRLCYDLPNLQPVVTGPLGGDETEVPGVEEWTGSWAVSFGMPSQEPDSWRRDVEWTRDQLADEKLLNVSVVASIQDGWTIDDTADDYARCAAWAVASGADSVETNFSCPNVSTADGQLYQVPSDAACVAERVRASVGDTPFVIKIGHMTDEQRARELIDAVSPFVDAIAMTNSVATTVRMPDGSMLFDGQKRGICGQATLKASLEQTRLFARLLQGLSRDIRLIGVGGAATAEDVAAYLDAGAESVHIATAAMANPLVAQQIRESWPNNPDAPICGARA
tara:strand:+ start:1247 stop:2350 length:1104 start_codon:yes stop_codon:yes gene_type:complete